MEFFTAPWWSVKMIVDKMLLAEMFNQPLRREAGALQ